MIAELRTLPAIPEHVAEFLRLSENDSVSFSEIASTLQRDPALSAKILQAANSSYFGMRQTIGTLKLALTVLGTEVVRQLALNLSLLQCLRDSTTARVMTKPFVEHATLVGGLAERLSERLVGLRHEEAFTAGLLHDVGKVALCRNFHQDYLDLFASAADCTEDLCTLEHQQFGFTHADVGAALLVNWQLPPSISDAVRLHHAREDLALRSTSDPLLAAFVRLANLAAHDDFTSEGEDQGAVFEDEAWKVIAPKGDLQFLSKRYQLLREVSAEFPRPPTPLYSLD